MSLRDALALKNVACVIGDFKCQLRRPSVADLAEAQEVLKNTPDKFMGWLVYNHLLEENGEPVFTSIDQVLGSDLQLVELIAVEIEKLYGEGGNSPTQQ
jgi:hypothetical protein